MGTMCLTSRDRARWLSYTKYISGPLIRDGQRISWNWGTGTVPWISEVDEETEPGIFGFSNRTESRDAGGEPYEVEPDPLKGSGHQPQISSPSLRSCRIFWIPTSSHRSPSQDWEGAKYDQVLMIIVRNRNRGSILVHRMDGRVHAMPVESTSTCTLSHYVRMWAAGCGTGCGLNCVERALCALCTQLEDRLLVYYSIYLYYSGSV